MCLANMTNEYLLLCGTGLRHVSTGCEPQGHRLIRLGRQKCVWLSKQVCDYAKYRTGIKTVLSLTSFGSRTPDHHWAQVTNVSVTLDMDMRGTCGQRLLSSNGETPEDVSVWEQDHRGNSIFPTKETTEETLPGLADRTISAPSTNLHCFGLSLNPEIPTYTAKYFTSSLTCHEDKQNWCFVKLNTDRAYSYTISIKSTK